MIKVLVVGAGGQVGKEVLRLAHIYDNLEVIGFTKEEFDVTDALDIKKHVLGVYPDYVINCSAYTNVDGAETDKKTAEEVNHFGARYLAEICSMATIPLIHFSTDYVFDGYKHAPYLETDQHHPLNYYGKSKSMGEKAIIKQMERHIILRTSWVYSHYDKNFVNSIINLLTEKDELKIINDQIGAPTSATDLANLALEMCSRKCTKWGVYNYTSDCAITWKDFASRIRKEASNYIPISCKIKSISTAEYKCKTERPMYSVLDCTKIKGLVSNTLKFNWCSSLRESMKLRFINLREDGELKYLLSLCDNVELEDICKSMHEEIQSLKEEVKKLKQE